jgi:uncharacterized linocin/CFP29 family protein
MSSLNRKLAPLSDAAWQSIDNEAEQVLKVMLAGRKLVDFNGPLGWETSAIDIGRIENAKRTDDRNVSVHVRKVQPLAELRREFEIARSEIDAIDRGAKDADLDPVVSAARDMAVAEDSALFGGLPKADIGGICPLSEHKPLKISKEYHNYPGVVARAISTLREAGVDGPYAIALGRRCLTGLNETTVNGFPVLNHVASLLDVPPIAAPAIDGALVLSTRGGDFELSVGRDFSIGYLDHDSRTVSLFMDESFTFRVLGAEAAVPLVYGTQNR